MCIERRTRFAFLSRVPGTSVRRALAALLAGVAVAVCGELHAQANQAPTFASDSMTRVVAENTGAGEAIGAPVTATDAGDTLTYSHAGTDATSFDIDSGDGQLRTKVALDYETKNSYTVTVTATDTGSLTATTTVTINVTDVNDVAPTFATDSETRAVAENTGAGQAIGDPITADDDDTVGTPTYTLEGADASSFAIDGSNGQLKTSAALNYEGPKNEYNVTVRVNDGVNAEDTVAVTINVTDVNEPPAFASATETRAVAENTATDTEFGAAVTATDPDSGDSITYSLDGTDKDSFAIGSSSATLKTKAALDHETRNSYTVTVKATDGNNLSGTTTVTISVTDLNDVAPEFANASETRNVAENTSSGTAFGDAFSATDPDTVGMLTYSLEGTDKDSFGFDADARKLKTNAALNYEGTKQYSVTVRVSDGANDEDTLAVTINVTDVNEAPSFPAATPTTLSVAENTATATEFGTAVTATDPDDDTLTYSVSGAVFAIDADSAKLKTSAALDHETTPSYTVTVTARDGGSPPLSGDTTLTIEVTDVNEAPEFPGDTPASLSVDENTATGTGFGTAVAATDPDDDALTYSVGGTDGSSFGINTGTGRLQTKAALDFESKTDYTVTVTASDGEDPALSATTTVAINVGDVDEPPDPPASPTVSGQTSSRIIVGWTAPANSGRPAISGYKLSWTTSRSDPVTPPPATPLSLGAGVTSNTVRGLDPATTYTFSVLATNDEGDGTAADVNGTTGANRAPVPGDAAPEFSIAENTGANVDVGTVSATDPETDADGNNRPVTYAMKSGDTGAFNLHTNTGQLTTKEHDYNYEADAEYNLVVAANDVHGGSADIAVTVNLNDVGGEVPGAPDPPALDRITSTGVEVKYTEPLNPGPPITGYSVRHRRTDTDPAGDWSSSGCLLLSNKEDTFRCTGLVGSGHYAFQVQAENADGAGSWSGSSLTDNDPPVFAANLSGKSWAVPENTAVGVDVGDPVTATDPDGGSVTYYLDTTLAGNPSPPFTIGTSSGQLATKTGHTYDHEAGSQINPFYVVAKDAAGAIARFYMRVSVTDVDEPPTGTPGGVSATAKPGGRVVVDWTKVSDSAGRPSITSYDIQYRTPPNTGSWSTHRSTATELNPSPPFNQIPVTEATVAGLTVGSEYEMQVAARNDEGLGAPSSSVTVTAIGNQAPTFTETGSVTRSVAENTPAGRDVGAPVAATDADHGKLAYRLEGTDADSFTIGGGNGQIRTKAGVTYNFEAKATYQVTVRVDDGQGGHATKDVTINLTDVAEDPKAPGKPTFPSSTSTSLTAEWDAPEDTGSAVTGYAVQYRNDTAGTDWEDASHSGTDRTVVITGLGAENTYEVRVRAIHGEQRSPWSATAEITLSDTTISFTQTSPISRELAENTGADVLLAEVSATIAGFPLRFINFRLEGSDAGAFKLVGPAGPPPADPPYGAARLTTADGGYNFEEQASYAVTVVAQAGAASARLVVNVTITDDDTEAPSAPQPPSVEPESLTAVTVTWAEPENAGPEITTYHLRYQVEGAGSWTTLSSLGAAVRTTTISSLTEDTTYEVQVQAVNAEGTGDWSQSGTGAPGNPVPNVLPLFAESAPVTRQVAENTAAGADVGLPVTATDEGASISYGLEGADGAAFTIDEGTGQIRTTSAGYDHEARPSYAVTVTATDDRQGVSRLDVTIEVQDLPEAPAAPGAPAVTAASPVSLDVAWTAPADNTGRRPITRYEVQYRTPPATGSWEDWSHAGTALTATITELESGTAYEVQVRAINDDGPGDAELPGPWAAGSASTEPNQPPTFADGTSTSRTLAENPPVGAPVGVAVAATDPENHALGYTLEGEDADSFAIDDGGVLSTVATEVYNFEAKPSYSLVVVATDEFGAAARIAVTVTLEDVPESLSVDDAAADEAAGSVVFTVTRVGASGTPASVQWSTEDGTATAGRDYRSAGGTLAFAANETEQTLVVTLLDDAVSEGPESFTVSLNDPVSATVVRALATIEDDDPEPGLSIADAAAAEGAGTVTLAVTLSAARENLDATVSWATSDGTAAAGTDYAAGSGTLAFAPGETEQTIAVRILDDEVSESEETFSVTLSDPVAATLATDAATATILDDDEPEVSIAGATAAESAAQVAFTVTLSPARESGAVTVSWATSDGTATAAADYAAGSGRLTFAAGETERTIAVRLLDDAVSEGTETFTVTLSDAVEATLGTAAATGTIFDDDGSPGLSIVGATAAEDAAQVAFTVALSPARESGAVTVSWATSDGTAAAGTDYVAGSGRLTFAAGETERTIVVRLLDDAVNEGEESFTVTLSDAVGATVVTAAAAGTIVDDDQPPEVPEEPEEPEEPEPEQPGASVSFGRASYRVPEGDSLALAVRLREEPRRDGVTIVIAVTAGSATLGEDYTAAEPASVVFDRGETVKTVVVRALADDREDEGDETFTLTFGELPPGVGPGAPATALVTITDRARSTRGTQAWLGHFAGTLAGRVADAVAARLDGIPGSAAAAGPGLRAAAADALAAAGFAPGREVAPARSVAPGELLAGSSFAVASAAAAAEGAPADTGRWGLWGRGAWSQSESGTEVLPRVDGEVLTAILGADYEIRPALIGLAVAYSMGSGSYERAAGDTAELRSALVSVHPYVGLTLHERLALWGLLGYGLLGELELERPAASSLAAETGLLMAALGARGTLLAAAPGGGFELAAKADGMLLRIDSEAVAGLPATTADVIRARLLLQAAYRNVPVLGGELTPALEVGGRYDFGNAESGAGLVVGGSLEFGVPRWGLSLTASGRGLLLHENDRFREWTAGGTLRLGPGRQGRGPALRVAPAWGTAAPTAEGLWSLPHAASLASPATAPAPSAARLAAELSYGLEAPGGAGLLTPYLGLELAPGGTRTARIGSRLTTAPGLTLTLDASRTEAPPHPAPHHGLTLHGSMRY